MTTLPRLPHDVGRDLRRLALGVRAARPRGWPALAVGFVLAGCCALPGAAPRPGGSAAAG